MKTSLQVTYFLMLMTPAYNLHFCLCKKRDEVHVRAWPNYLWSVLAAGRQAALLPSPWCSFLKEIPLQTQGATVFCTLWLKANFVGKGSSGQLLFTESKHLWHIMYDCTALTRLPSHTRNAASERDSDATTPRPKYLQISPLALRRHSLLVLSNPHQQKIVLHSLTTPRHKTTF